MVSPGKRVGRSIDHSLLGQAEDHTAQDKQSQPENTYNYLCEAQVDRELY